MEELRQPAQRLGKIAESGGNGRFPLVVFHLLVPGGGQPAQVKRPQAAPKEIGPKGQERVNPAFSVLPTHLSLLDSKTQQKVLSLDPGSKGIACTKRGVLALGQRRPGQTEHEPMRAPVRYI